MRDWRDILDAAMEFTVDFIGILFFVAFWAMILGGIYLLIRWAF